MSQTTDLLDAVPENSATIADALRELLVEKLNSNKEPEVLAALELTICLWWHWPLDTGWQSTSDYVFDACSNQLEMLYPRFFPLCVHAVYRNRVHISDLIKWYGIESIFSPVDFALFRMDISILGGILAYVGGSIRPDYLSTIQSVLRNLGNTLLSYPAPWFRRGIEVESFLLHGDLKIEDQDHDILFGIFVVLASVLELDKKGETRIRRSLEHSTSEFFRLLFALQKNQGGGSLPILEDYGFTTEQQQFILRWVRKEINLVN